MSAILENPDQTEINPAAELVTTSILSPTFFHFCNDLLKSFKLLSLALLVFVSDSILS